MATPQYLYEDSLPHKCAIASAKAINSGDLCGLAANTLVSAIDETWGTAVAAPSAPTCANSAVAVGSPLTNALTGVKISYQFPWGEGALSAAGTATPTAAAQILVSGAPLVPGTNALYTNVYVETAAGSGTYKLWGITYGESVMVNSYGAGQLPGAGNPGGAAVASGAQEVTQYTFAQKFLGVSQQTKDNVSARVFGSSEDNVCVVSTGGVFEFDLVSATYEVGDLLAAAKDTGNALLANKLQAVAAGANDAIAVAEIVERGTTITRGKVRILSRKLPFTRGVRY